ncbi:SOUL family heme-binding protein [Sphingomonas sp. MMS24-J45]|uniref:SOUL family heme-binding protein n=1 Tax=Sphingomonas sp. MMS24-J45 TaxID=3238806 RepID=UPI00384CE52A
MKKRTWAIAAAAVAGTAVAGAAAFIVQEKRIEQPPYTVERKDGAIEIRRYPELLVAETETSGPRQAALGSGFSRLADYIFAKNCGGEGIAMTAPVLSERDAKIAMTAPVTSERSGDQWRTRFVMPAQYTRETLPPPGPGVTISTVPARRVAVYRFSGVATDAALAKAEAALRAWLTQEKLDGGAVSYAFYNSPFMPAPLRRNEVMITLPG